MNFLKQFSLLSLILRIFSDFTERIIYRDEIIIRTESGKVFGSEAQTIGGKKIYYAFQGIPYAEPPNGRLRFKPPVPVEPWIYPLNATKDPVECVQGRDVITGSEDCLYLSIYTTYQEDDTLHPVMVWIHGGVFWKGNNSYGEYGPDYFLDQNVVIVTINYRLGVFGFLSTEDMASPGNYGMKDQVLALKWIRDNIHHFGGDPDRVTLFGQSAGSASTSYHLQSDLSKDLFQQAIMQSGTSLCPWAISRRPREAGLLVAKLLNISSTSTYKMVDELQKIDYKELQQAANAINYKFLLGDEPTNGLVFAVVPEPAHPGAFFTGKSYEKLSKGRYPQHIPTMIGFNGQEGCVDFTLPMRMWLLKYDNDQCLFVPADMNLSTEEKIILGKEIKKFYFGSVTVVLQTDQIVQFVSDDQFIRPIRKTAQLLSKNAPTYFYRFAYEGMLGGDYDKKDPSTRHSEELPYMWRSYTAATFKDEVIRSRLIKLWTNFAKFGNPTPEREDILDNLQWPMANVTKNDLAFLNIGEKLTVFQNPRKKALEYWDKLYNTRARPPFDTY